MYSEKIEKFFVSFEVQPGQCWRPECVGIFRRRNLPHGLRPFHRKYKLYSYHSIQRGGQSASSAGASALLVAFFAESYPPSGTFR